ncbi:DUF4382 domain-containing protein [Halorarum salinum]|uniref:DUF4382 domain-containing protein n=1 Tax=Halorarum salinum TaxID=2743089 RepID=A0A7D5L913_9EURY|nr:DUF4382 domain-containing protein [Halobaculum salinum]QLG60810.1 DUF4382 domain-containing protein [Halobaculum salinum]
MVRTGGNRRALAALAAALLVVTAGCGAGVTPGEDGSSGEGTGTVNFFISDQQNAIDQFEQLNVTVSAVILVRADAGNGTATPAGDGSGATDENGDGTGDDGNRTAEDGTEAPGPAEGERVTYGVDDVTVDLTELRGANATRLGAIDAPEGSYTQVVVRVESVEGTLTDGSEADVKLPSERLRLNKGFAVGNGESVDFVFDVTVFERGPNGYVLRPVAGESGTGDEVDIEALERGNGSAAGGGNANGSGNAGNGGDGAGNGANGNDGADDGDGSSDEANGNGADGTSGNGDVNADTEGSMTFYVSDEENAIGDFERLNVTVTAVGLHRAGDGDSGGWVERDVDDRTVDLTTLTGANATRLGTFGVGNGTYDRVFVHVGGIDGTLADGESVNVKLPSSKLQVDKRFTVGNGESVDFVYDMTAFEAGNSGKYILKPVVGESGTGDEVDIDPVDEDDSNEGDADDESADGDGSADDAALNASFVGDVSAGEEATVAVTRSGTGVENATVSVTQQADDGLSIVEFETDANGTATFDVDANATGLSVTVEDGGDEVELEREFEADGTDDGSGDSAALRAPLPG